MKVLVVDDEYINNVITSKILNKVDPSINVIKCTNPVTAYDDMKEIRPELVFLDINMPVFSGWQFLDKMNDELCSFPIILLTSSVSKQDSVKAMSYNNVVGYIEKPFSLETITAYINKAATATFSNHAQYNR